MVEKVVAMIDLNQAKAYFQAHKVHLYPFFEIAAFYFLKRSYRLLGREIVQQSWYGFFSRFFREFGMIRTTLM